MPCDLPQYLEALVPGLDMAICWVCQSSASDKIICWVPWLAQHQQCPSVHYLVGFVCAGGLLDYAAVLKELDGKIGALGLDVQWSEPFDPDDPVAKHPR